MTITKPYLRTVRPFVNGKYRGASSEYIEHPLFASDGESYVRGFLLLQKDLQTLVEYIEPSDQNECTYSFRTYELLLRACTEVETNCKAIMTANKIGVSSEKLTMKHYWKIERSHFLSQYAIEVPYWKGTNAVRAPFAAWGSPRPVTLPWYQKGYNAAKHDRASELRGATLRHLIDAVCGVVVLLTAQYLYRDFRPGPSLLAYEGPNDGYENAIGDFFRIKLPNAVPPDKRYDFDWQQLGSGPSPFEQFDFDSV